VVTFEENINNILHYRVASNFTTQM